MTFAAVAVGVGGAAISAGTSMAASSAQGSANKKAGEAAAAAAAQARADIEAGVKQARGDVQPYATVGGNALNNLAMQMGLGGANEQAPKTGRVGKAQDPLWDSLLRKYNPKNNGLDVFSKTPAYAEAQKEYTATKQAEAQANPQYGALAKNYGMEQYKQDPGYTPMVNSLEELQATPGYKFHLEQGLQSLGNSAAARGSLLSGRQLKDVNNYAQGQASTGYQAAWDRAQNAYQNAFNRDTSNKSNTFNRLQGMANSGQTAATNQGGFTMQGAGALAGVAQNLGNTQTGLALAQGQNQANMYTGIGNALNQGIGGMYGAGVFGNGPTPSPAPSPSPSPAVVGGGGGPINAPNSNFLSQNSLGFQNQKLNFG